MLRPRRFPATCHSLDDGIRTDDVEIRFVLSREGGGGSVFIYSGRTHSRNKVVEAVASHQVRDGGGNFIPQVKWMRLIHHRHRQGEAIRYAVVHAGKAAEVRRLATHQGYIKGFGITEP